MRTIDEQVTEIKKRKAAYQRQQQAKQYIIAFAVGIAACIFALVGTALSIPKLANAGSDADISRYGSLILSAPYMGYVIVGIIAFALGILVALLCRQIRELNLSESDK